MEFVVGAMKEIHGEETRTLYSVYGEVWPAVLVAGPVGEGGVGELEYWAVSMVIPEYFRIHDGVSLLSQLLFTFTPE